MSDPRQHPGFLFFLILTCVLLCPDSLRAQGGTVFAWGSNGSGERNVPTGLSQVVSVTATDYFSMAVRANGTITTWGDQSHEFRIVPAHATNVISVSSLGWSFLALRRDGTLAAWGFNSDGETDIPPGATNIVAIANGGAHQLALRDDGVLFAWGANHHGQSTVPYDATNVVAVSAGHTHSLAVTKDGRVLGWGEDANVPEWVTNVVAVTAGPGFNLAARRDGTVIAWGLEGGMSLEISPTATNVVALASGIGAPYGVRSDGSVAFLFNDDSEAPLVPPGLAPAFSISASLFHALGIRMTGNVHLLRQIANRAVSAGDTVIFSVPAVGRRPIVYQWYRDGVAMPDENSSLLLLPNVQAGDAADYHVVVGNGLGQVSSAVATLTVRPSAPSITVQPSRQTASPGGSVTFIARAKGTAPLAFHWQKDDGTILGAGTDNLQLNDLAFADAGIYRLVVSNEHGMVISDAAALVVSPVFAWGNNSSGQIDLPFGLEDVTDVAAGASHSLALLSNGTLVGWGSNDLNESSTQFPGLENIKAIAAGDRFSLALRRDGTVRAWGDAVDDFFGITDGAAVSARGRQSLVLRSNGTAVGWSFSNLQLSPPSATNLVAVAAGYAHSLGLRSDGTVVAWSGQSAPLSATNILAIAAGNYFSMGLRADGTVLAWGENFQGVTDVPQEATNIISIAAGGWHAMALRDDGRLIVWGYTNFNLRAIPPELVFASAFAGGDRHSLALLGLGEPKLTREPASQAVIAGSRTLLSAAATGAGPMSYQWVWNESLLPGAVHAYLAIPSTQAEHAGEYRIIVSNSHGAITSSVASVTVTPSAPQIVQSPRDQSVRAGVSTMLSVVHVGTAPLWYQWQLNGIDLPGATGAELSFSDVRMRQAGEYRVIVRNALGEAVSAVGRLHVYPLEAMPSPVTAMGAGPVAWGDFNNDGRLDLLVSGETGQGNSATAKLFRNDGGGAFTEVNVGFESPPPSSLAWGDFDNDGFLDILMVQHSLATIWRNNRDGTFTNLELMLGPDPSAKVSMADYDNDGWLDILLGGRLYRNLGANQFALVDVGFQRAEAAFTAWGDYDQDGWPDLLLCGQIHSVAQTRLYRNLGDGTFSVVVAGLPNVSHGSVAWVDYDGDGWLDVLISGQGTAGVTELHRNNGDGTFSKVDSHLPPAIRVGLALGDFNNDGTQDVFLAGLSGNTFFGRLYQGRSDGVFARVEMPFPTNVAPLTAWGDFDGDGRLDLAVSILSGPGEGAVTIYRNYEDVINSRPQAPGSVHATAGVGSIHFVWSAGGDAETPVPALTYNLRVGRSPGAGDVLAADADSEGLRRVPRYGNVGPSLSRMVTNLPFGRYYWAVQSVDSAFAGSPFTEEQMFTYAAATLPASGVTSSQAVLNGQADAGESATTAWFEWGPTPEYGASTPVRPLDFSGTGPVTASLAALIPGTTYHYRLVISRSDGIHAGGMQTFITANVPSILAQPTSSITASNATLHALVNPMGSAAWVSFEYGLGRDYGTVTPASLVGTGRDYLSVSRTITGLTGGQIYHFRVFATNEVGLSYTADLTFATTTEPEASTLAASDIGPTSATLNASVKPSTLSTDVFFEYGPTLAYGSTTIVTNVGGGTAAAPVALPITDLSRATAYQYRVVASNATAVTFGANRSFSTTNDVIALPPTEIGMAGATLQGLVNPNGIPTSVTFEYGATTNLGTPLPGLLLSGETNLVSVAIPVDGLLPGSNYFFRIWATNAAGVRSSAVLGFQSLPQFSVVNPRLAPAADGSTAWGDYDNDGWLDLLVTGLEFTRIYRNQGDGNFETNAVSIPGATRGSVAWGDYNNDGWLDILIVGTSSAGPISRVYRNRGDGTFAQVPAGLAPLARGVGYWGDFNNNGRQDILLVGDNNGAGVSKIYWNNGDETFTDSEAALPTYLDAYAAAADYDTDGKLDIVLMGRVGTPFASVFTKLFRNTGNGVFEESGVELPGLRLGFADWGDFNGDGYPDLLLGGNGTGLSFIYRLFRNNGDGTFTNVTGVFPPANPDAAFWGDFDNNGLPDILLRGQRVTSSVIPLQSLSGVLQNNGVGLFERIRFPLPEIWRSAGGWADYTGDGRLDAVISGLSRTGEMLRFYRNNHPSTNTPPAAPRQLSASNHGNVAVFSWAESGDLETPVPALTYNLRIGRTPGGNEIVSALSAPGGWRRVPRGGNTGHRTQATLQDLRPGRYFWSVQAVDAGFAGSEFADEQVLDIPGVPFASTLTSTNVTATSATLLASVSPEGAETVVFFEWGPDGQFGMLTGPVVLAAGYDASLLAVELGGLVTGAQYHYRVIATNSFGTTAGQERTLRTVAPPRLGVVPTGTNSIRLSFSGSDNAAYRIFSSTNLLDWIYLGPATATGGEQFRYVDGPFTNHPARFYRVVSP